MSFACSLVPSIHQSNARISPTARRKGRRTTRSLPQSINQPLSSHQELGVRVGEQAVRTARLECPGRRDQARRKGHDIRGGQVRGLRVAPFHLVPVLPTIAICCCRWHCRRYYSRRCVSGGCLQEYIKMFTTGKKKKRIARVEIHSKFRSTQV